MKKIIIVLLGILLLSSCSTQEQENNLSTDIAKPQGEKQVILALWDSLTAGFWVSESENYPTKLESTLADNSYNYEVINAGVSGNTSKNLLDRADLYLDKNPDIVLLVIWGNDGLRGLATVEMKENILKIIELYEQTDAKIVLAGMDIPINLWLSYRADFMDVYEEISQEKEDIYFLEYFLEGVWWYARYNLSDRIHPNPEGYDIVVDNLYEFLESENIITK